VGSGSERGEIVTGGKAVEQKHFEFRSQFPGLQLDESHGICKNVGTQSPPRFSIGITSISGEANWGVFADYLDCTNFSAGKFEIPLKFALPRTGAKM
jgi:hypothetical protein